MLFKQIKKNDSELLVGELLRCSPHLLYTTSPAYHSASPHTHTHTLSLSFFRSPPLLEVIEQYVRRQALRGPFRLCDYGSAFPTGASLFLSFHVPLIIIINR